MQWGAFPTNLHAPADNNGYDFHDVKNRGVDSDRIWNWRILIRSQQKMRLNTWSYWMFWIIAMYYSVLRFLKSFLHLRKTLSHGSEEALSKKWPIVKVETSRVHLFNIKIQLSVCKIYQNPPQNFWKKMGDVKIPQPLGVSKKKTSEPSNVCLGHWAAFEVLWVLVVKSLPATLRIQQIGCDNHITMKIQKKTHGKKTGRSQWFHTKRPQEVTDGMQSLIGTAQKPCVKSWLWDSLLIQAGGFNIQKKSSHGNSSKKCGDQKLRISSRDSCSCIIITLWQSPWCCKQPLGRLEWASKDPIHLAFWGRQCLHSMDAVEFVFSPGFLDAPRLKALTVGATFRTNA